MHAHTNIPSSWLYSLERLDGTIHLFSGDRFEVAIVHHVLLCAARAQARAKSAGTVAAAHLATLVLLFAAAVFAAVAIAARAQHTNTAERRFTEAALAQIAKFRSAEKAHVTTLAFATAADVTAAIRIASAPCGTLTFEYAALRSKAAT
jgi:hypothetical protein